MSAYEDALLEVGLKFTRLLVLFPCRVRQVIDEKLVPVSVSDLVDERLLLLSREDTIAGDRVVCMFTNCVFVRALVDALVDCILVGLVHGQNGAVKLMTRDAVAKAEGVEIVGEHAENLGPELAHVDVDVVTLGERGGLQVTPEFSESLSLNRKSRCDEQRQKLKLHDSYYNC